MGTATDFPVVKVVAFREWKDGRFAVVSHIAGSSLCTLQLLFPTGHMAYVGDFPSPFDALLFGNEYEWPVDVADIWEVQPWAGVN